MDLFSSNISAKNLRRQDEKRISERQENGATTTWAWLNADWIWLLVTALLYGLNFHRQKAGQVLCSEVGSAPSQLIWELFLSPVSNSEREYFFSCVSFIIAGTGNQPLLSSLTLTWKRTAYTWPWASSCWTCSTLQSWERVLNEWSRIDMQRTLYFCPLLLDLH